MDYNTILEALASVRPSSTFLLLLGYTNKQGEVSDRYVSFHVSYTNALQRSIVKLESVTGLTGIDAEAQAELIASYRKSLDSDATEIAEPYVSVRDAEGNAIRGVKRHDERQTVYIYGMQVPDRKRIIVPGTYREVNKRAKTLAKEKLSKDLPVSRWRQFILSPETVGEIRIEKMRLSFED